ncbi:MAG: DUF4926 domain-containing protein [Limnothrix sp. RL_2_0]|nr:DUF4926 domain-containing protein [Limnothrix sp. RL_2_0]
MNDSIKLFDVVALVIDLPDIGLCKGQVGTVVEMLDDGHAFEVEFSDANGRVYESLGLLSEQVMVLCFEPNQLKTAA